MNFKTIPEAALEQRGRVPACPAQRRAVPVACRTVLIQSTDTPLVLLEPAVYTPRCPMQRCRKTQRELRSGNSATSDSLPPIASIERRNVEVCMSVRFSMSEICLCATPKSFAILTCVISRAA
jgi:hypothetical protein